jgi:16S rRNA (guanine527-N7)-methyltransferase
MMDIGAGNGLPGLIFACLAPERSFNLIESDGRKAEFLKHIAHSLGLSNVQVSSVRFENLKGTGAETAVSRGFASISKTLLACNRIFTVGGQFYHFKGSNWATEIAEVPPQLISVWTPVLAGEYTLPASQARRAIVFTKKIS